MHLKRNDGWATLFVLAAAVLWGLWSSGTAFANLSTRVVGAAVLALGYAACMSDQAQMSAVYGVGGRRRVPMAYAVVTTVFGAFALAAGVITLVGGSQTMLAVLVVTILTLWLISTVRHAITNDERREPVETRPLERPA